MITTFFRACRNTAALLVFAAAVVVVSATAHADRTQGPSSRPTHVALVIANSAYTDEQGYSRLYTPRRDAGLVQERLESLGYDVTLKRDLIPAEMHDALTEFAERAENAEVAVVYYAGHGVSHQNINYLVPILGMRVNGADIPSVFVSANALARAAAAADMGVVVWDACREDAPAILTRGVVQDIEDDIVTPPAPQENVIMMYSTSDKRVASDGPKDGNSPFAAAFAEALERARETPLAQFFQQVTQSVQAETNNAQRPVSHADLNFSNHLLAPAAQDEAAEGGVAPPEFDLQNALDTAAVGEYIRIPSGTYQGPFQVTRPVVLIGAGREETVLVSENEHPALVWRTPPQQYRSGGGGEGSVNGVYNLAITANSAESWAALYVYEGAPIIRDVTIAYKGSSGVRVSQKNASNAASATILEEVRIRGMEGGEQNGVHVDPHAQVVMRGGETRDSKVGLYADTDAKVRVFGVQVHENGWGAVLNGAEMYAYDGAAFQDNEFNGVYAQSGRVCLESVRIRGNNRNPDAASAPYLQYGVYVAGQSARLKMSSVLQEQENVSQVVGGARRLPGIGGCARG